MKEGDRIRVINGEHKGKKGEVIGRYIAEGIGMVTDEDLKHRWFIQFDDGEQDILKESDFEIIPPE